MHISPAREKQKFWTLHIKQTSDDFERWRKEGSQARLFRTQVMIQGTWSPWVYFVPQLSQPWSCRSQKPENANG